MIDELWHCKLYIEHNMGDGIVWFEDLLCSDYDSVFILGLL